MVNFAGAAATGFGAAGVTGFAAGASGISCAVLAIFFVSGWGRMCDCSSVAEGEG